MSFGKKKTVTPHQIQKGSVPDNLLLGSYNPLDIHSSTEALRNPALGGLAQALTGINQSPEAQFAAVTEGSNPYYAQYTDQVQRDLEQVLGQINQSAVNRGLGASSVLGTQQADVAGDYVRNMRDAKLAALQQQQNIFGQQYQANLPLLQGLDAFEQFKVGTRNSVIENNRNRDMQREMANQNAIMSANTTNAQSSSGGSGLGSAIGTALGAGAGFLFGGPPGAVAGAGAGATAGGGGQGGGGGGGFTPFFGSFNRTPPPSFAPNPYSSPSAPIFGNQQMFSKGFGGF